MSEDVNKVAIRAHIPELDGMSCNEVLPIFREKFGEPDEIDDDNGFINNFYYEGDKHEFVPVESLGTKGKWGIEHTISREYSCDENDVCISTNVIQAYESKMRELFLSVKEIKVWSYTWYNGVDEPMEFEL